MVLLNWDKLYQEKLKEELGQEHITIADLTGVAVQDIQISKAVLKNL